MAETITLRKASGDSVSLKATGKTVADVLKENDLFNPREFSVCITGANIEDGKAMLSEEVLDKVTLESGDELLILPKVVGGF